jgi:hypothetical protein
MLVPLFVLLALVLVLVLSPLCHLNLSPLCLLHLPRMPETLGLLLRRMLLVLGALVAPCVNGGK